MEIQFLDRLYLEILEKLHRMSFIFISESVIYIFIFISVVRGGGREESVKN